MDLVDAGRIAWSVRRESCTSSCARTAGRIMFFFRNGSFVEQSMQGVTMRWAVLMIAVLAFSLEARAFERREATNTCGDNLVQPGEQCDGTSDSACPGMCDDDCRCPPATTFDIESQAHPPNTPGSPGVSVTNANLLTQFGKRHSLNKATYTRFRLDDFRRFDAARGSREKPDAILRPAGRTH